MLKGAVLAGGLGKRLRPLTDFVPKPLLFVGGKTMLGHALSALQAVGIGEVAVVVSPHTADAVRRSVEGIRGPRVMFYSQEKPMGTADAVHALSGFLAKGDRVLVVSSDVTLNVPSLSALLAADSEGDWDASVLGVKVSDPSKYGVLVSDGRKLVEVVEKPKRWVGDLINSGVYVLSERAVRMAGDVRLSERGEREVTDVFSELSKEGRAQVVPEANPSWWHDVGSLPQLLAANRYYLERGEGLDEGYVPAGKSRATPEGGKVVGPSHVSEGASVRGRVGPYATLEAGVSVGEGATVSDSVLMRGSSVEAGREVEVVVAAPRAVVEEDVRGEAARPILVVRYDRTARGADGPPPSARSSRAEPMARGSELSRGSPDRA